MAREAVVKGSLRPGGLVTSCWISVDKMMYRTMKKSKLDVLVFPKCRFVQKY